MVGIVVVSHSPKIAYGVVDLASQMGGDATPIAAAGGVDDETIGTNAERIQAAIDSVYSDDGVIVLIDMGSALMSAEVAIELLDPDKQENVIISNAPLVEGAIVAAIGSITGKSLVKINEEAENASAMQKTRG